MARKSGAPQEAGAFNQTEVQRILSAMDGQHGLMARMLYGSSMQPMECQCLRVKDVDLQRKEIMVSDGKSGKDRVMILPASLCGAVRMAA